MSKAIRVHAIGGPETMKYEEHSPGGPSEGEVQLRHTAIGLNYIDVYDRIGLYPMPMPAILGREGAGVVVSLGAKTKGFRKGDRVAYVHAVRGSYCQLRNVPSSRLVKIPKSISDSQAAALMLKGLTAQFLLRRTYRVKRGDWVLIHAAVGGVGLILCQWAKALGAKVIGVVGNKEKVSLAKKNGCLHVLVRDRDAISQSVRSLTKGVGVAVVYDSVGKDTFIESLDSLAPMGMMVSYGNASGAPAPIAPVELAKRGSLFLTRPSLFNYISKRKDLESGARELFSIIATKKVKLRIGQRYALADAAKAHRDLEDRKTTGSTVLMP